jgi:tetratricopeptide (TPR) repeat protein
MKKIFFTLPLLLLLGVISLHAQDDHTSLEQERITTYFKLLFTQKDTVAANKVKESILLDFPHGKFARRIATDALDKLQGDEFFSAAEKFRQDFSIKEWYNHPDDQGFTFVNFYRIYAVSLWNTKQNEKLKEILPDMEFSMLVDLFRHSCMFLIMKAPIDPKEYVDISVSIINEMYQKKDTFIPMYGQGNVNEGQSQTEQMYYYLAIETEILQRSGRYEEAIECMNKIPDDERFNFYPQGNQAYVQSLEELGKNDAAIKALEASAGTGVMTKKLYSMLRKHYEELKVKPSETFDEYFNSLKLPSYLENLKNEVADGLVYDPYTPFNLSSIQGTEIKSDNFSKKDIVVLDFWATWCAPFIAALEGMQMAVDKYQGDPNVKFYFVCTQDEPNKEQVMKVWERKNLHHMLVLFDSGENYSDVYKSMFKRTSAIPQKAVIKNGRIRYRAEGYSGSPSQLMDEISTVIELLKEENNN